MNTNERAERASALLEDAVLTAAFEAIREGALSAFENSDLGDTEAHQLARARLWAVQAVRAELESAVFDAIQAGKVRKRGND